MDVEESITLRGDVSYNSSTEGGKWRHWRELPLRDKALVASTIGAALTIMGITIGRMAYVGGENPECSIGAAVLVGTVFSIFYVVEGVSTTRPSELGALALSYTFIVVFLIGDYVTGHKNGAEVVRMIAAIVLGSVVISLSLVCAWIYDRDNRLPALVVGESASWQQIYSKLLMFQDVLKLDLQIGESLLILTTTLHLYTGHIIMLVAGFPFLMACYCLGYIALKKESRQLSTIFLLSNLGHLAYLMYSFYVVSTYLDPHPGLGWATLACSLAFLSLRICVLLATIRVMKHFGSGLKERL